jgi:gamma-glutamyltranspeptidase/glutathione hydrolase
MGAVVLAVAALVSVQEAERPGWRRSVAYGRHGMVAAAHPAAVRAGLEILQKGGSAVDAAIAVNACLGVVEPMSCGIGGDLFAIVWDAKTRKLHGLNASGRCPAAQSIEKIKPAPDGTIPLGSPDAWTVPGAVDGWFELHGRFGKLPMKEVLAPAIRMAREGEPVPRVIAGEWKAAERAHRDSPGFAEIFLPGGRAPAEGELFRNPRLAGSYEAIAEGGRDAYYRGPIAEELVAFSQKVGGRFAREDFASHRSDWVEPISTTYRGVTVWELPPNGQGLAALQMLNILEGFDLKAMGRGSADFWHTMIEAKKLAFEDRARYYADPAAVAVPVRALLSKEYARGRAALVDPKRASERPEAGVPAADKGDTTYVAVGDEAGNMVSLIQSNYYGFGSGHAAAGFGLQNRGACFSLKPGSPNALAPGKRPFHTIIPAFATRDGAPWMAFGVMGGSMQPQGHVQVLVNLLDFGMDLQQAGDAPRYFHSGSSEPMGTSVAPRGGTVALEEGVPASVLRELAARGHRVTVGGAYGGYQAVRRDPVTGIYAGATESRKDGMALGY